jgi:spore photoproduct lyase
LLSNVELYIDQQVADLPMVIDIQSRSGAPQKIFQNIREVFDRVSRADDPIQKGKELLILTRNQGAFIKKCPGTRAYTCCGYQILHLGTYCTMDCSYCVLQTYYHPPVLQYFVNLNDLKEELYNLFSSGTIMRIGTGEFTDSLIWNRWFDINRVLVEMFSKQKRVVLELKTKTTDIEPFEHLDHQNKTVLSWSLNTPQIISSEENRTTSLDDRLKAAARCQEWGYPLAFHFDPMVIYDGCELDYKRVIRKLFSHISPDHIIWISLGTFRFHPDLKQVLSKRFPHSQLPYGEFIKGLDGKMRYFKPMRIALYRKMISWIRDAAPNVLIYFCMEDGEVWKKSLGFEPIDRGGLKRMLDETAVKHCGISPGNR